MGYGWRSGRTRKRLLLTTKPRRRARGPAEPLFAGLEMEGGGAESEQGDPLAVEFSDIAEALASQASASQLVANFQELVEGRTFLVADPTHGDSLQNVGFAALLWLRHAHGVGAEAAEVQSFLTPPLPCPHSSRTDEIALVSCNII